VVYFEDFRTALPTAKCVARMPVKYWSNPSTRFIIQKAFVPELLNYAHKDELVLQHVQGIDFVTDWPQDIVQWLSCKEIVSVLP
jgi:hypothetical protein